MELFMPLWGKDVNEVEGSGWAAATEANPDDSTRSFNVSIECRSERPVSTAMPSISSIASSLERRQREQHEELPDDVHHDFSLPCSLKSKRIASSPSSNRLDSLLLGDAMVSEKNS
jgi:hypothetical protein